MLLSACRQEPDDKPVGETGAVTDTADLDDSAGPVDADGDGVPVGEDCDDQDATVFPGAPEFCDEVDDDCDGAVDEDVMGTWYADADGDGWGDDATAAEACVGNGLVAVGGDCADDDPTRHPGAAETDCTDPVDHNCDGTAGRTDADGDGWAACEECDDASADVRPDAQEVCNDVDDDCDGRADEDATDATTFYEDDDGDGFGDAADTTEACAAAPGWVADATDCDDRDAGVNPDAAETCDGVDEDCDGAIDDGASDVTTWYLDDDGDGYGDDAVTQSACEAPSRYVDQGGDCDDGDADVSPDGVEVCNDVDDDCDGDVDSTAIDRETWYTDADDDGYGDPASSTTACDPVDGAIRNARDCDDADATLRPYAWEDDADGVDNDCDGLVDTDDTDVVNLVTLGDDASTSVTPAAWSFPSCGNLYTSFNFESNGRITFGGADTDYTETAAEFAADSAVATLWDDLDPRVGAPTLAWVEHDDAIAVYWRAVSQYGATDESWAELVAFDDGRVLLAWGALAVTDGLAGFSCATATTYGETDLGAAMDGRDAGRWGVGDGTEEIVYELFDGSTDVNDLADTTVRLCGNAAGGDPCLDE